MSKVLIFPGEYILYILCTILVVTYLLWKINISKRFIQKHMLAVDILMILSSIGVVVFLYYLPYLLLSY